MRRLRARDDGSTLPLILVFGLVALVLVLVVAAATDLYLARKRLLTLADGDALVGEAWWRCAEVHHASGRDSLAVAPGERGIAALGVALGPDHLRVQAMRQTLEAWRAAGRRR